MKRTTFNSILLAMVIGLSGCATMTDGIISCETGIRNRILAQKAWGHWSWCYTELDCPYHFACGFKAGYRNILDGGNGCQPTLPPQCYWKPAYQTPEGRCKVNSWFDGFSHGALAAKQDGYGGMGEIPISPTARMNLEMAQMPAQQDLYIEGPYIEGVHGEMVTPDGGMLMQPPQVLDADEQNNVGIPEVIDGDPAELPNVPVPVRPYE